MTADATTLPPRPPGGEPTDRTSRALALSALAHYRALHHRLGLMDPDTADDRSFTSGERWLLLWAGAEEWPVTEDAARRIERLNLKIREVEPSAGPEWLTAFPRAVAAVLDRRSTSLPTTQRRRFGDRITRPMPRAGHGDHGGSRLPTGAGSR